MSQAQSTEDTTGWEESELGDYEESQITTDDSLLKEAEARLEEISKETTAPPTPMEPTSFIESLSRVFSFLGPSTIEIDTPVEVISEEVSTPRPSVFQRIKTWFINLFSSERADASVCDNVCKQASFYTQLVTQKKEKKSTELAKIESDYKARVTQWQTETDNAIASLDSPSICRTVNFTTNCSPVVGNGLFSVSMQIKSCLSSDGCYVKDRSNTILNRAPQPRDMSERLKKAIAEGPSNAEILIMQLAQKACDLGVFTNGIFEVKNNGGKTKVYFNKRPGASCAVPLASSEGQKIRRNIPIFNEFAGKRIKNYRSMNDGRLNAAPTPTPTPVGTPAPKQSSTSQPTSSTPQPTQSPATSPGNGSSGPIPGNSLMSDN